jgi:acyl carrier protein
MMTENEIYRELTGIVRDILVNDDILLTPKTVAKDVDGWDSFNHINIMIAVESHFHIKMTTSEIESLTSVKDLVSTIERKTAANTDRGGSGRSQ